MAKTSICVSLLTLICTWVKLLTYHSSNPKLSEATKTYISQADPIRFPEAPNDYEIHMPAADAVYGLVYTFAVGLIHVHQVNVITPRPFSTYEEMCTRLQAIEDADELRRGIVKGSVSQD